MLFGVMAIPPPQSLVTLIVVSELKPVLDLTCSPAVDMVGRRAELGLSPPSEGAECDAEYDAECDTSGTLRRGLVADAETSAVRNGVAAQLMCDELSCWNDGRTPLRRTDRRTDRRTGRRTDRQAVRNGVAAHLMCDELSCWNDGRTPLRRTDGRTDGRADGQTDKQ